MVSHTCTQILARVVPTTLITIDLAMIVWAELITVFTNGVHHPDAFAILSLGNLTHNRPRIALLS